MDHNLPLHDNGGETLQIRPIEKKDITFLGAPMLCLGMHAAHHCVKHEKTNKFAAKHFTRIQIFLEILHFCSIFKLF